MESADLQHIERRARLKYELGRARRALLGFAPALLVVVAASLLAKRPDPTMVFGGLMFGLGVVLLWYGRDLKRAVLPGLAAGIVPLTLAICANRMGHACLDDRCLMVCIPACVTGGVIAGLAVAVIGHRQKHRFGFWLAASAIALLTGAMGCACIGYSGVIGLAIGYGAGMVPAAIRALLSRNSG
jgi:hypothetical protein